MYLRLLVFLFTLFLSVGTSLADSSPITYKATLDGFSGPETRIHDGFIAADGSIWNDPSAITSKTSHASIRISLEQKTSIKAILIQGDWDDVYIFEGSLDNSSFEPLWYAPVAEGVSGLQRRWVILENPKEVTSINVRAGRSDGILSLSEIQLYSDVPANWSDLTKQLTTSKSNWLHIGRVEAIKEIVAGLGMILLAWYALIPTSNRLRNYLMILLAVVAAAGWCNFFQFHFGTLVHRHEFFHYYLGSKYSPELGYTKLYDCTAVADNEDSFLTPVDRRLIRNLETNSIEPAASITQHTEICKSKFTEKRWISFKQDLSWFREHLSPDEYLKVLKDHGYNATPIWNFNGYILSSLSPASTGYLYALSLIDSTLLAASFIFAGLTFGIPAAFACLLFFTSNYIASFAWTGGAFLRADWVVASIVGISLLKREKWRLGGGVLAFAGLTRIFPFALLGGILFREIVLFLKTRKLSPEFIKIVQGAAIGCTLLVLTSTIPTSGFSNWGEFIANTKKHFHTLSTNVVGLKIVVGFSVEERTYNLEDSSHRDPFDYWKARWNERISKRAPILLALQISLLGLIIFAASKLAPWGAAISGIGLVLLINLSNYDYYVLAPFGLLASSFPSIGLLLGILTWLSWSIPSFVKAMDEIYFASSILVTLFTIAASLLITTSKPNQ